MNTNLTKSVLVLLTCTFSLLTAFGQSPNGMSYQAVIRNSSNALVSNQAVGMQISILQGSASGAVVYVETQTPTSNANGLVSLEIGAGSVVSGTFSTIDWANGPYFVKTETDPAGGTNYSISGTSQLLSVPYALHAKTAESITGGITETDPVFNTSVAKGITSSDTANWNNKQNAIVAGSGIGISGTTITNSAPDKTVSLTGSGATTVMGTYPNFTVSSTDNNTTYTAGTGISISGNVISATSSDKFYLGQDTLGGYVYYIYKDAGGQQHGLIVSKTETTAEWQSTVSLVNADRTEDGAYNTGVMTNSPAKTWVQGLGTGWYLPSIDELSLLWHARYHINKVARVKGTTLLSTAATYWSSTEVDAINAFRFYFSNGTSNSTNKPLPYNVRGVRAF